MYTDVHTVADVQRLPLNLLDALRALEASESLTEAFGKEFTRAYIRLRRGQWDDYSRHLTQWERETTLDI
jgi:glutamine synthetase